MATDKNGRSAQAASWTSTQAYVMAVICLLIGLGAGYFLRGSQTPAQTATETGASDVPAGMGMGQQVTPAQLKAMADKQAEPMLKQLSANPNDATLLANIGNTYYDAQQFQDAIGYYDRALAIEPGNASVRTDLGTAYWYLGNADKAIEAFQTALKTQPDMANALFNMGIVQWQGKMDATGAIATWKKLLETNPQYQNREKVQQLIAEAQKHMNIKPGTKTDKPTS
jgi:cytochrome c-type biogenesis protein CcmH/NrfG